MKTSLIKVISVLYVVMVVSNGCESLIEVAPPIDQQIGQSIYETDATAASVLTGIYTEMSRDNFNDLSMRLGLSADELVTTSSAGSILEVLYTNSLTNQGDQLFWSPFYSYIFKANSAIEGINNSKGITPVVRARLLGEAKFIRAFMYFYLVNLYGDAPLLTSTNIKTNSTAARTGVQEIYDQIISDLTDAAQNLSDDYLKSNVIDISAERLRPNKYVAIAMLARVYLFTKKWQLAEEKASKIIDNSAYYKLEPPEIVYLKDSKEAIWQLQPVGFGDNTIDAQRFVLKSSSSNTQPGPDGAARPVYLSRFVFNDFEPNDLRKINWCDSVVIGGVVYPYAYKYKSFEPYQPRTEYTIVLRVAEQYLIRAEARAEQGRLNGTLSAANDINVIRERAGLGNVNFSTKEQFDNVIMQERKRELFTEWGHRWLDMKRKEVIDKVMKDVVAEKGGTWLNYKSLYPIPISDIQNNPSFLGHQNPGYPER